MADISIRLFAPPKACLMASTNPRLFRSVRVASTYSIVKPTGAKAGLTGGRCRLALSLHQESLATWVWLVSFRFFMIAYFPFHCFGLLWFLVIEKSFLAVQGAGDIPAGHNCYVSGLSSAEAFIEKSAITAPSIFRAKQ